MSGFHILSAGVDGLAARVQLINKAEQRLDLQYFIFRGDTAGSCIVEALKHAAERGVRIRILVDDGDTTQSDERVLALDGYRGIQVRVFNPFDYRGHHRLIRNLDFVLHRSCLDYRMHNKLLIADGALALAGGRNIGDQYFQIDPQSQFADDDLVVVGPNVLDLSRSFAEFWNSDMAVPVYALHRPSRAHIPAAPALPAAVLSRIESGEPLSALLSGASPMVWATGKVLADSPDKELVERRARRGRLMSEAVESQISLAHRELEIVSPYFVPTDKELGLLEHAPAAGAQVRILTNSLESNPQISAHSGYRKVRVPLLTAGARIFEVRALLDDTRGSGEGRRIARYGNFALHGKMYVFDAQRLFLGSWNYDQRSARINTEIGILIDNSELAGQIVDRFNAMVRPEAAYEVLLKTKPSGATQLVWHTETNKQELNLTSEPSRGWWQRLTSRLLALLPLQREL